MINLMYETLQQLYTHGRMPSDVQYVCTRTHYCSWDEFAAQAETICYDNGWGSAEINPSLKIVGNGWWLERWDYDGSEGWKIKTPPTNQSKLKVSTLDIIN